MKNLCTTLILFLVITFNLNAQVVNPFGFANNCYKIYYKQENIDREFKINTRSAIYDFKPSALGEFMLYSNEAKKNLVKIGLSLGFTQNFEEAGEKNIWILEASGNNNYFLIKNKSNNKYLKQKKIGRTYTPNQFKYTSSKSGATLFKVQEIDSCNKFPEAELNVTGEVYAITDSTATADVWGMANIHTHSASEFMGGGYVNHGAMFSPYGLPSALKTCASKHGNKGNFDLLQLAVDSLKFIAHNPNGYPEFTDWPAAKKVTHQKEYYQWLNRARLGGLRLLTIASAENTVLGRASNALAGVARKVMPELQKPVPYHEILSGSESHEKMMAFVKEMQDYIDAQEGGPGKGWFRIVKSHEQARIEMNNGNLAIVLGVEIPDLFDCIDGAKKNVRCTRPYIAAKLDKYQEDGVSVIWPIHDWDNDFGGARIGGIFSEIPNILFNGHEFEWEAYVDSGDDYKYDGSPTTPTVHEDMFMDVSIKDYELTPTMIAAADIATNALLSVIKKGKYNKPKLPSYEEGVRLYVNKKGLTDTGRVLIEELMKRGMMIDLDHCGINTQKDILEILEKYEYPVLYSHSNRFERHRRVYKDGGIVSPILSRGNVVGVLNFVKRAIELKSDYGTDYGVDFVGFPFATDAFGAAGTFSARSTNEIAPLTYPFYGYGKNDSIMFDKQKTGNRIFDINTDGLAHLGLLPDMIRDMEIIIAAKGGAYTTEMLDLLFKGAEEYLRHWKKVKIASDRYRANSPVRRDAEDLSVERTTNKDFIAQIFQNLGSLKEGTINSELENSSEKTIAVYPTIVENTFTISSLFPSKVRLILTDISGTVLTDTMLDAQNLQALNYLENKAIGLYLLRLIDVETSEFVLFKLIKK